MSETVTAEFIESRITEALDAAEVNVTDLTGTSDHWQVEVRSPAFAGKSRLQRHRMIYDLFSEELKGPIHALTLTTEAPDEAT